MAQEPKEKIKIEKANILVVAPGELWGIGNELKDKPSHILTIQDANNTSIVHTVKCLQRTLPDHIKTGAVVDNLEFGVFEWNGQVENKIKFEKPGGGKFGGGGYRGISPEELQLKRDDLLYKVIGVGYSYALEVCKESSEPITVEKFAETGNAIADAMLAKGKLLKG